MQILNMSMDALIPALQAQLAQGKARLGITGTSMLPLLRSGQDSVVLTAETTPEKGDIIFYRRKNGRYVLHRIIAVKNGQFLCCGDNQWRKEKVTAEQVLATVCSYYRHTKIHSVDAFLYRFYVNLLPLRRIFCRLRDWLLHR